MLELMHNDDYIKENYNTVYLKIENLDINLI